jgi:hypothetical protein
MKRLVFLALLTMASATFAADGLPQGTFKGTGEWRGTDGSTGTYTIVTTTTATSITSRYVYEAGAQGGREQASTRTLVPTGAGFFSVADEQQKVIGRGCCLESQCFWTTEFPGGKVEESLRFDGVTLEKLGGKSGPGFTVAWREKLTSQ